MKRAKVMISKVIVSGNVVEVYQYSDGILYDYDRKSDAGRTDKAPENWDGKRDDNLRRARQAIRRIVWSNMNRYAKFFTLTYAENMTDYKTFQKDWKLFLQRLRRIGIRLKYLYVLEYQKRGAIHAHVVVFNPEYIPHETLEKAWDKGFIKINKIKDVKNLGAYVCKYLTKDSLKEYGSHSYHVSRGLETSNTIKIALNGSEAVEDYTQGIDKFYENVYIIPRFDGNGNKISECRVKYIQGRWK